MLPDESTATLLIPPEKEVVICGMACTPPLSVGVSTAPDVASDKYISDDEYAYPVPLAVAA